MSNIIKVVIVCILFIGFTGHIYAARGAAKIDSIPIALDVGYAIPKPITKVTDEEYEILCRIVEAEATDGNIRQKMNVASCVMARVEGKSWENTIKGVVFSHSGSTYQFTPISDGRYYSVKITATTRMAVSNVLRYGKTHSYQYFCSYASYAKENSWHRNHLRYGFKDGEHIYCNP